MSKNGVALSPLVYYAPYSLTALWELQVYPYPRLSHSASLKYTHIITYPVSKCCNPHFGRFNPSETRSSIAKIASSSKIPMTKIPTITTDHEAKKSYVCSASKVIQNHAILAKALLLSQSRRRVSAFKSFSDRP